ncbi:MAG TPA: NAD-dependent epimerase/dehydratase family protein [Bacteroidota bacterium]|nr:NAD-dependent epimerase/dehydratase family protein [Bacteroidota bacterium]
MKILVTGGAGFIASHVADECVARRHGVVVLDDLSTGAMQNVNPKAVFLRADIRDAGLDELFRKERFDVVIHHAAQMDVRKSVEDPGFDASVNILGTINLLENTLRTGVKKFIFASTGGAIYGEQDYFPADEEHPVRPLSPYGIAKLSVEKYLFYYAEVHALQYVSLRYGNVYGPRQNPRGEAGVVAIFAEKMLAGGQPVINGEGLQTRDYVYVGDVVSANMFALGHDRSGIFNVGTGIETDVNTLFRTLRELTGSTCKEEHGPAKKGEQLRSVLDARLLNRTFGWSAGTAIAEGLKMTVEYFRSRKKPDR